MTSGCYVVDVLFPLTVGLKEDAQVLVDLDPWNVSVAHDYRQRYHRPFPREYKILGF